MGKLTRVIQRVFGETGGSGEFGKFGSNAASPPGTTTKDLTLIQSLSQYLSGWYSATANAGEPPRIQDRNALDLLFSSQLKYLFQNGLAEWLNDADQLYYADVSFCTRSGSIYQAILGDDVTNINTGKDPLTEPLWWRLVSQLEGVDAWDVAEAVAYETGGVIVERFGMHYASSGKTGNSGKDPADPQSDSWWIPSEGWNNFKKFASKGESIPGGMHPWTDFSSGDYQQNIKLDEIIRGGITYNVFGVVLDGTVITSDSHLNDDIFGEGTAKEYPWIDEFAPDNLGTRTLIDMRGRSTRAMTAGGGVAPTLAEVQEDAGQKISGEMAIGADTGYNSSVDSELEGVFNRIVSPTYTNIPQGQTVTGYRMGFNSADSVSPNAAKTDDVETRVKALVRGVDYIIVIIAQ